jgi:endonuclease/exonuclease/phosphatase family metal-dependent hydrolase
MMPRIAASLLVLSLVYTAACADAKPVASPVQAETPSALLPQSSSSDAAAQAQPSALKVATFNINFGNADLRAIADTIAKSGADFVFLQETNKESASYLKEHLNDHYKHSQFNYSDRRWAAGGFGFLSKRPFDAPRYLPANQGLFGTFLTTIDLAGTSVTLINLHLSPIRLGRASNFGEAMTALAKMEDVHNREAETLSELFDSTTPTIIAGDLNSTSIQAVPKLLRDRGFVDAIDVTIENANSHQTWRWPVRGSEVGFRIDYVFHSPHFVATEGEIMHSEASDHHLVVTDLSWSGT